MAEGAFRRGADVLRTRLAVDLNKAIVAAGSAVKVEAQILITTGSVSGASHVPSAPGEAPNQDTGVLGNNIESVNVAPLRVRVTSKAPYALALEFGTSKMEARPYLRPAVQLAKPEIKKIVTAAVRRAVRSSFRGK